MGIAVPLQELAERCTRDAGLVGTVHDDLVLFVERLKGLPCGGEMNRTGNMLRLVGPLCQRHHQAEVFLALQLLLQLLVTDCSQTGCLPAPLLLTTRASRSLTRCFRGHDIALSSQSLEI